MKIYRKNVLNKFIFVIAPNDEEYMIYRGNSKGNVVEKLEGKELEDNILELRLVYEGEGEKQSVLDMMNNQPVNDIIYDYKEQKVTARV